MITLQITIWQFNSIRQGQWLLQPNKIWCFAIFKMDKQEGPTEEHMELCYLAAWMQGELGENGYMYMYSWVPLPSTETTTTLLIVYITKSFFLKKYGIFDSKLEALRILVIKSSMGQRDDKMTIFYSYQTFATNTGWPCSWNWANVFDSFFNQWGFRIGSNQKTFQIFWKKNIRSFKSC